MLVLATAALAGSAGKSNESASSTRASGPAAPAEFGSDTGGVEGTVTDDQVNAVANAQVGLIDLGMSTTSDPQGRFSFSHVAPGQHQLSAAAVGYSTFASVVNVEAGKALAVDIKLVKLASTRPYSTLQIQKGLVGCGTSIRPVVSFAACGLLSEADPITDTSGYDRFLLLWPFNGQPLDHWDGGVFEMQWSSTQALGKGLSFSFEYPSCFTSTTTHHECEYAVKAGKSPLTVSDNKTKIQAVLAKGADDCGIGKNCTLQSRVFATQETLGSSSPADVGVTAQQPFTQYFTAFFYGEPPAGYTAIKS